MKLVSTNCNLEALALWRHMHCLALLIASAYSTMDCIYIKGLEDKVCYTHWCRRENAAHFRLWLACPEQGLRTMNLQHSVTCAPEILGGGSAALGGRITTASASLLLKYWSF